MLKAVEFGLLGVTLLIVFGLIVVGPAAYSGRKEEGEAAELGASAEADHLPKP